MGRDEVDQCWRCKEDWERERNGYISSRRIMEEKAEKYKRIAQWLAETLAELSEPTMGAQTAEEWIRTAEQEVAYDDELNKAMDYSYQSEG